LIKTNVLMRKFQLQSAWPRTEEENQYGLFTMKDVS
jgi:hypothetical protein